MSYSILYGITPDYSGEIIEDFHNSLLFSVNIWKFLGSKYLRKRISLPTMSEMGQMNALINNSKNTSDRICWELTWQQIFFTKNKEIVAGSIEKFCLCLLDTLPKSKDTDEIRKRFLDIANEIRKINEAEYPYFVFENTSCEDNIKDFFCVFDEEIQDYVEKPLSEQKEFVTEFVKMSNGEIVDFISNLEFDYKKGA